VDNAEFADVLAVSGETVGEPLLRVAPLRRDVVMAT
jgi:hypothetical protein